MIVYTFGYNSRTEGSYRSVAYWPLSLGYDCLLLCIEDLTLLYLQCSLLLVTKHIICLEVTLQQMSFT